MNQEERILEALNEYSDPTPERQLANTYWKCWFEKSYESIIKFVSEGSCEEKLNSCEYILCELRRSLISRAHLQVFGNIDGHYDIECLLPFDYQLDKIGFKNNHNTFYYVSIEIPERVVSFPEKSYSLREYITIISKKEDVFFKDEPNVIWYPELDLAVAKNNRHIFTVYDYLNQGNVVAKACSLQSYFGCVKVSKNGWYDLKDKTKICEIKNPYFALIYEVVRRKFNLTKKTGCCK